MKSISGLRAVSPSLALADSSRTVASLTPGMKAEMVKAFAPSEDLVDHLSWITACGWCKMLLFTAQHTNGNNPHQPPSSAGFQYDIGLILKASFLTKTLCYFDVVHV